MAHPAVNGGGDNGVPMILTDPDVFVCCGCRDTLTIPIYEVCLIPSLLYLLI